MPAVSAFLTAVLVFAARGPGRRAQGRKGPRAQEGVSADTSDLTPQISHLRPHTSHFTPHNLHISVLTPQSSPLTPNPLLHTTQSHPTPLYPSNPISNFTTITSTATSSLTSDTSLQLTPHNVTAHISLPSAHISHLTPHTSHLTLHSTHTSDLSCHSSRLTLQLPLLTPHISLSQKPDQ